MNWSLVKLTIPGTTAALLASQSVPSAQVTTPGQAIDIAIALCPDYAGDHSKWDVKRWAANLRNGLWTASYEPPPQTRESEIEVLGMSVEIKARNGIAGRCAVSVFDRNPRN